MKEELENYLDEELNNIRIEFSEWHTLTKKDRTVAKTRAKTLLGIKVFINNLTVPSVQPNNMKTIFNAEEKLTLLKKEYNTYPEAEEGIKELIPGTYQVQKVFVKN